MKSYKKACEKALSIYLNSVGKAAKKYSKSKK